MHPTTSPYRTSAIASRRAKRFVAQATLTACAVTMLAAPGAASAADVLIAPDPAADEVTALDKTVVWVSGKFGNQVLMQRSPSGVIARVTGAPGAASYRTIDLDHDRKGRLVLTYQRCSNSSCKTFLDNLSGTRASYRHLTLTRCSLTTAPAVWRTRLAYGLMCRKPNKQIDDKRSGLYVKTGTASPKRLRSPQEAVKFGISNISAVDLRGTRVAAIVADVYEYAFTQSVRGTGLHSLRVASSEGDSGAHATGLALGGRGVMWALTDAEHAGDPNQAIIWSVPISCREIERLINPAGPNQADGFLATDLAVDGSRLYLVVPGTGIVTHTFAPEGACVPLT